MNTKIKFWQWPNILAIDAAIIAVSWQWVFGASFGFAPSVAASLVLGLSVWLTYIADRLFDVSLRPIEQLLSHRHRFAKTRFKSLWMIWSLVLLLNIAIALNGLNATELKNGFILLVFCLGYTALSQTFSRRFFPKELLVAIIFTCGTQVFLPVLIDGFSTFAFALLCFANCVMIAKKEKAVDTCLRVRSLSSIIPNRALNTLLALSILCALFSQYPNTLLPVSFCLTLLQLLRQRFQTEPFRVLCDTALLVGPALYFFFGSGVFVR